MNIRENRHEGALLRLLPEQLNPQMGHGQVAVSWAGQTTLLDPLWIGQGFPADVRRGKVNLDERSGVGVPVLIATQMSKGARKLLNDAGISWADQAGYGRISTPDGIFISREPVAQAAVTAHLMQGGLRWSPLFSYITEIILSAAVQNEASSARDSEVSSPAVIADLAESSYASVAKALTQFDEVGYTQKIGATRGPTARRILKKPGELLSDWTAYYTTRLVQIETLFHVPWRNPDASVNLLASGRPPESIIVSGGYASSFLAPFLTQVPDLLAYVEHKNYFSICEEFERNIDVTRVQSGERVRVRSVGSHLAAFARKSEGGAFLAPPVRVYADLMAAGDRSQEAAEVLRGEVIGF